LKISTFTDPNIRPVKALHPTVASVHRNKDASSSDMAKRASMEYGGQDNTDRENVEQQVIKAIELANKSYVSKYTRLEFSIHEKTKEIMVKVFDRATDEIIREIPPEKILDLVAYMWEAAGIIVDDKA
jgi:flagellar protein FlaG